MAEMSEEKRPRGHQKGVPNPNGGRKATTGLRRVRVQLSMQPDELEELRAMAERSGKTLSRFVLDRVFGRE